MNENPGETPNPLNPTPEMDNDLVSEPDTQPISEPTVTEKVTETSVEITSEPNGNVDPAARPMEQAPVATPEPKKKKTGLIVGAIVALFLLIAGGVAAALMLLNTNKGDAVAAAIEKIMSGKAPDNLAINGSIDFNIDDNEVPFSKLSIDVNAEATTTSKVNRTELDITADFRSGDESVKLGIDEIYGGDGDLFIKLDGITEAINSIITRQNILNSDTVNSESKCADGDEVKCQEVISTGEQLTQTIAMFAGVGTMVDNQWIKLPLDDVNGLVSNTETDSDMNCLANLIDSADKNTNSLAGLYKNNPFITSTKENLSVASKKNPIYKISVDSEKFANFVDASQKSEAIEEFYACAGYENTRISADDIAEEFNNLPEIYVEVDGDNNFTRLYFEAPMTTGCDGGAKDCGETIGTMVVDLDFSYPVNINVPKPTDYKDLTELLQSLMSTMFNTEDIEITE